MNERGVFVNDDPLLSFHFVNLTRPCIWPVKFVSLKRSIAIKKHLHCRKESTIRYFSWWSMNLYLLIAFTTLALILLYWQRQFDWPSRCAGLISTFDRIWYINKIKYRFIFLKNAMSIFSMLILCGRSWLWLSWTFP